MSDLAAAIERAVDAGGVWIPYLAIALIALGGSAALVLMALDPSSTLRRQLAGYQAGLDKHIDFLLLRTSSERIIRGQAGATAAVLIAAFLLVEPVLLLSLPFVILGPSVVLRRKADRRIAQLELQLDTWLIVLSNALKAAPSLGEALGTSASLSRAPISEEVDLVLKEVRLGSPIDRALLQMAERVNSRTLWGAVATLLVSRQTGGDVSRILEDSAGALREMSRLEGVVKSKTADGRMQAYALAGMPFLLIGAIHAIDPKWLEPLGSTTLGMVVVTIAGILWVLGFVAARRILAVDL